MIRKSSQSRNNNKTRLHNLFRERASVLLDKQNSTKNNSTTIDESKVSRNYQHSEIRIFSSIDMADDLRQSLNLSVQEKQLLLPYIQKTSFKDRFKSVAHKTIEKD